MKSLIPYFLYLAGSILFAAGSILVIIKEVSK